MEHAEARELLEIAAVEPGGLDRLMAGDTIEASALASHLAGCPDCTDEMERLRRASAVIRQAIVSLPPPDLRDRTLAFVAAVGRERGAHASVAQAGPAVLDRPAAIPSEIPPEPVDLEAARRRRGAESATSAGIGIRPKLLAAWAATLAAAIVVSIVGTTIVLDRQRGEVVGAQAQQIAALAKVADWTLRIDADPDANYVALASTGGGASATVAFSGESSQVVVLANGLTQPPAGMEYRCWLETGGTRQPIGKMFFAGDISYWVGDVAAVADAGPGTKFGVSLVPIDGSPVSGDPVLLGEL